MATTTINRSKGAYQTAIDVWRALVEHAGLELHPPKRVGRDDDLEAAVLEKLTKARKDIPLAGSLAQFLSAAGKRVSSEELLVAVLASLRPFGVMMDDILKMLVRAKASNSGDSVSIQFRFDEVSEPIVQTLEQFRATTETVVRTLQTSAPDFPPNDQLFDMSRVMQNLAQTASPWGNGIPDHLLNLDEPSSFPTSGNTSVDKLLGTIRDLVADFRTWAKPMAATRKEFIATKLHGEPNPDPDVANRERRMASLASDLWDITVLHCAPLIAQQVSRNPASAVMVESQLRPFVSALPRRQQWVEQIIQELLDILNLPVWSKRHELYAVWVGALLLRAIEQRTTTLQFHTAEGVLSFSFGGARLATFSEAGVNYDVWTELRSRLLPGITSAKRIEGIQPDYRILRTDVPEFSDATVLVVECKHYLQQSTSNFSEAASDYAANCPGAHVVLVNHGPMAKDRLFESIRGDLHPRIRFHGELVAGESRVSQAFMRDVQDVLFPLPPIDNEEPLSDAFEPTARKAGSIKLKWSAPLRDLDLHLRIGGAAAEAVWIDFTSKGNATAHPYARHQGDDRGSPGTEDIQITRWLGGPYDIFVHDYPGSNGMAHGLVTCEVAFDDEESVMQLPENVGGKNWWHVARIDVARGAVRLVNTFADAKP